MCGLQDLCSEQTCYKGIKFQKFEDKKDATIQGYSCETKSSCTGIYGCFLDTSCTHFHWWLKPTGSSAKVYKLIDEERIARIEIKYKTMIKSIPLRKSNKPNKLKDVRSLNENNI